MLVDAINAVFAIATAVIAFREPHRIWLILFLAAPNLLGITTFLVLPDGRNREAVMLSTTALLVAFGFCARRRE